MTTLAKFKILWLCLILFLFDSGGLQAQEPNQEYQVKLAFMVNFARFISWPEGSFAPEYPELTLGVVGDNPFGSALDGVRGKTIGNRFLRVQTNESLRTGQHYQILFISQSETNRLAALFNSLGHQPVVTVSDIPGFVAAGGDIEFVLIDDRLSFAINNKQLKGKGIEVSSSLLNLAASVR